MDARNFSFCTYIGDTLIISSNISTRLHAITTLDGNGYGSIRAGA